MYRHRSKVAGLVLGVVGALCAAAIAFYGYATGNSYLLTGNPAGIAAWRSLGVSIPALCLIGAGLAWALPVTGGAILVACALEILVVFGIRLFSLITIVLIATGAALVLAAAFIDAARPLRWKIAGQVIAWLFLVCGVTVAGEDLWVSIESGRWSPIVLGQLWFDLNRTSLIMAQAGIQRYVSVRAWSAISQLLAVWAGLALLLIGLALLFAFRRWRNSVQ